VSCIGIHDDRGDGVFDRDVSVWGNDFSNMTALFELADGGTMRTNEFRRVGYWSGHESRFRFYGTEQVFEQSGHGATLSVKTEGEDYAKGETRDISQLFFTKGKEIPDGFGDVDPALMQSFASGTAPVQDRSRLPKEFEGAHNGHEGSHHCPGRRLRPRCDYQNPPSGQRLEGCSVHPSRRGGVRLRPSGWRPAGGSRLR